MTTMRKHRHVVFSTMLTIMGSSSSLLIMISYELVLGIEASKSSIIRSAIPKMTRR